MRGKIDKPTIAVVALLAALCLAPRDQAASAPEIDASVSATLEDFFPRGLVGAGPCQPGGGDPGLPDNRQGGVRDRRRIWRRRAAHSRPHRRLLQYRLA